MPVTAMFAASAGAEPVELNRVFRPRPGLGRVWQAPVGEDADSSGGPAVSPSTAWPSTMRSGGLRLGQAHGFGDGRGAIGGCDALDGAAEQALVARELLADVRLGVERDHHRFVRAVLVEQAALASDSTTAMACFFAASRREAGDAGLSPCCLFESSSRCGR